MNLQKIKFSEVFQARCFFSGNIFVSLTNREQSQMTSDSSRLIAVKHKERSNRI